jgi:hypothetical protein
VADIRHPASQDIQPDIQCPVHPLRMISWAKYRCKSETYDNSTVHGWNQMKSLDSCSTLEFTVFCFKILGCRGYLADTVSWIEVLVVYYFRHLVGEGKDGLGGHVSACEVYRWASLSDTVPWILYFFKDTWMARVFRWVRRVKIYHKQTLSL